MLPKYIAGILTGLVALAAVAQPSPDELLTKYPAQTTADAEAFAAAWFAMDDAALAGLIGELVPMGEGDDVAVRFAVSGLAKYATESGHADARTRFEGVVSQALQQGPPDDVAAFLVRQLELAGTDASVPVLSTLLQGALCAPAAQALASIGTPAAREALEVVRASAADACLLAIEQALEDITPSLAVVGAVPDGPVPARIAAIAALVNAGEKAKADEALRAAILSDDFVLRREALRLATRTADREVVQWLASLMEGATPEAQADIVAAVGALDERSARSVVLDALESSELIVRIAAIEALPHFGGGRVADVLLERFKVASEADEAPALKQALLRMHADDIAEDLAEMMPTLPPEKQVDGLDVLSQKQARDEVKAVLALAGSDNEDVRLAADDALSEVAGPDDVGTLLDLLMAETSKKGQRHLQDAIVAAVADIEDDDERAVPVVEKMASLAGEQRALLMEILPRIGGDPAYAQIMADIPSQDPVVRKAAIEAVADWQKTVAITDILELAKQVQDDGERETLLRGYLRIVREAKRSDGKKVQLLGDALATATTSSQKKLFIADLGNLRTVGSLQLLVGLTEDEALRRQAVSAALNVALPGDNYGGLEAAYVGNALNKLMPYVDDEDTRKRMEAHIAKMPQPDAEGFIGLFNGKDLTGWTGDTAGWGAGDGMLICDERSHGNVYSDLAFSDFILRFEFKLTEGANNGVGIRTPLYGHAAYDGMEIQIIDNSAHLDGDGIKPYQYHGSIYGVAPAKVGFLKPVGEWNAQEVLAIGSQITVILNGETIVDEDLEQWRDKPTPDDKEHPGLHNASGHIAFLGHGARVEFRNIRIKEVE